MQQQKVARAEALAFVAPVHFLSFPAILKGWLDRVWTPGFAYDRRRNCPPNCPCQLPKQGLQSQQQPNRSIKEVIEKRGFARKNEDGGNADRRLANRCVNTASRVTLSRIGVRCHPFLRDPSWSRSP